MRKLSLIVALAGRGFTKRHEDQVLIRRVGRITGIFCASFLVLTLLGTPQLAAQAAGDQCRSARNIILETRRNMVKRLRELKVSRDQYNEVIIPMGKKQNEIWNQLKPSADCAALAAEYCEWFNDQYSEKYDVTCAS